MKEVKMKEVTLRTVIKTKKDDEVIEEEFTTNTLLAEDFQEASVIYGEECVYKYAMAAFQAALKRRFNSLLKKGDNLTDIQNDFHEPQMKDFLEDDSKKEEKLLAAFTTATPEEQKKMIKKLKEIAAGK
jgi:hypothetical protein